MVWSFKALVASFLAPTPLVLSPSPTFEAGSSSSSNPEPPSIREESQPSPTCRCRFQEDDYCPYCENDANVKRESVIAQAEQALSHIAFSASEMSSTSNNPYSIYPKDSDTTYRPRKLRKLKLEELRYEPLETDALISARRNSKLSIHSMAPLLNTGLLINPRHFPPSPELRTRRKLEKKDKRQRRDSTYGPASTTSNTDSASKDSPRSIQVIKSKSFLKARTSHTVGPRPKPLSSSIDTDTLVSLAWTGEVQSSVKSSEFLLLGSETISTPALSSAATSSDDNPMTLNPIQNSVTPEKRPTVLRKQKEADLLKNPPLRPWTLAMAITDDGITDEKLVDDLENMRIKENPGDYVIPDRYSLGMFRPPSGYETQIYGSYEEYPIQSGEDVQDFPSPSDASWNAARHALLLCRELVRTERRYLTSLKILITSGTTTPPPPLMLSYLPALITASDALLTLMEENPSVQGVSLAFLKCTEKMKDAFVSWSSVVGQFFDDSEGLKNRSDVEYQSPPFLTSSPRSLSAESSLSIVVSEPNKIRKNLKTRPTVRDLAILPTQRIMRYVLLFKELYTLTPVTVPSFAFVETAMHTAGTIAHNSNMAQDHATFK